MDAVITYVDCTLRQWQNQWRQYMSREIEPHRFREWGTLRYVLRSIDKFLPFIDKVHLVVSDDTQVPSWVDRDSVNIVTHDKIIDSKHLPTFNSNVIEFYLNRIPELANEFLYFNDDVIACKKCKEHDFFVDGKPRIGMKNKEGVVTLFHQFCLQSSNLARHILGIPELENNYIRPIHSVMPIRKDAMDFAWHKAEYLIDKSFTMLRAGSNYNVYLFSDISYLSGRYAPNPPALKYFAVNQGCDDKIEKFLAAPTAPFVCLNDCCEASAYIEVRKRILQALEILLPEISKFELKKSIL